MIVVIVVLVVVRASSGSSSSRLAAVVVAVVVGNTRALILKHNPTPSRTPSSVSGPGASCGSNLRGQLACQPSKRRAFPRTVTILTAGGIAKSSWLPRRVTRISCGTLSKIARAGRRT